MNTYRIGQLSDHKGSSLVELLVASTLGILISLAVARAFITTKEGFMLTLNGSQMQENGRFAVEFITESLYLSGFRPVASSRSDAFPSQSGWSEGQVVSGADGVNSLDSLSVRFYGYDDGYISTCDGTSVPAGDVSLYNYAEQSFSIDNGNLVCNIIGDGLPAIVVVQGVEKLDILYGTDGDGDSIVDAYKTATQVQADDGWDNVRSLKFYVIARSFDELNTLENNRTYQLPDGPYTVNDNIVRDLFISTVGIRNVLNRVSST